MRYSKIAAAAALLSVSLAVGATATFAATTFPALDAHSHETLALTKACAEVETGATATSCASAVTTSLNASAADVRALASAIRSKQSTAAARAVLERHGLTATQLKNAKIVIVDKTGGAPAERARSVTIDISCCPLTITITIKL